MRFKANRLVLILLPLLGFSGRLFAADANHHHQHKSGAHDATVNHPFDDVAKWVKVFDDPGRDAWQKPRELVAALGLKPGQSVADLGAGTGYFERSLSEAVGVGGTVFAVDVEPAFIPHLRQRAEREGTANVVPVLASFDNPRLPAHAVALVLIVDTYHHINDRLGYMRQLSRALAAGGRVVVVDFVMGDIPVGPPPAHRLAKDVVIDEMKQSGYKLAEELKFLPYQYMLVFSR